MGRPFVLLTDVCSTQALPEVSFLVVHHENQPALEASYRFPHKKTGRLLFSTAGVYY